VGSPYLLLKILHIFAAILFLGNLVVTGVWKTAALRTGDAEIVAFAQRHAIRADSVFSGLGVLLLFVTGTINATLHFDYHGSFWLFHGGFAFVGMLFSWCALLIPIERKQLRISMEFKEGEPIPSSYRRLGRIGNAVRAFVVLIALCMLYLMVYKPVNAPL